MGKLESDLIKKKMEERESTAPCLQGVSTEFVLIENVRVCKVWDKHRSLSKHTTNEYNRVGGKC